MSICVQSKNTLEMMQMADAGGSRSWERLNIMELR